MYWWGNSTRTITNEQAYIGDKSVKLTSSDSNVSILEVRFENPSINDVITAYWYIIGSNAKLELRCMNNDSIIKYINTNINSESFQKYILSSTVPENTTRVNLRIYSTGESTIYADNFYMSIQ